MKHTACTVILLALALALTGCSAPPALSPTPTLAPSSPPPLPTPNLPPAEDTAEQFLSAWQLGDYATMYRLLSPKARLSISEPDFTQAYKQAQDEAGVLTLRTAMRSTLRQGQSATAAFQVEWDTPLVGTLQAENTMTLTLSGGQWDIDWTGNLIWPGLADGNVMAKTWSIPRRANIYDREGLGLAVEGKRVIIGVVPGEIADEEALLAALSPILDMSPEAIHALYAAASPGWFVPVGDISGEWAALHYATLNALPGVSLREKSVRAYRPDGLAAHTIGYVGIIPQEWLEDYRRLGYRGDEWVGLTGLEAWGEPILGGTRGGRLDIITPQGELVATLAQRPVVLPRPIYTTLKRDFQEKVEQILGDRHGAIVAMDPNNGQIVAIASHPGFDSNEIVSPPVVTPLPPLTPTEKSYVNRALMGNYHPGSTFKPIVMAAALESGLFTPQSVFNCPGYWDGLGPGFRKKCWLEGGHGTIDLVTALSASCNVTFYQLGYALNQEDENLLPQFAHQFGLGQPTGIVLNENAGLVPDLKWKNDTLGEPWYAGDAVNISIGQGDVNVTPLQMAVMYSAIANGGTVYKPQLVTRIGNPDLGPEEIVQPEVAGKLPISAENLAAIQQGLRGVVAGTRGTARHIFIGMPVAVAGKTGTAETATARPDAWFASYAPYDAPELVVIVLVENAGQGSSVAAPIARQVFEAYFGYALTPLPPILEDEVWD
jgi:penicillin-binding protein 2